MKRIICFILLFTLGIPSVGYAETNNESKIIDPDIEYVKHLAYSYKDRYIVSENKEPDVKIINEYFEKLSAPLTLEELDSGKLSFDTSNILEDNFKKEISRFKFLGGLSGCKAEFEPKACYNIYRNITLVGGKVKYTVNYTDADAAYWQAICTIENMTKEIVPYFTRLAMLDKVRNMYIDTIQKDNFVIFLMVDGKINSVWKK